jgi:hypothetical protein
MAESTERKDVIAYYKKVNKFREMTLSCDFAKDKRMMMAGSSYPYLSAGKIRQQFAPLYSKYGLEFEPDYTEYKMLEPIGAKGLQHWVVTLTVRLIDVDTGYAGPEEHYFGEGSDILDKGLRKAMTAAYKSWLSDKFGIEEGIDPEVTGGESTFTPKTAEEKVEIKTKLAEKAVKPPVAPSATKVESTPAPKAEKPAKPATEASKEVEKPKDEAKPVESAEIPEPGCDAGFKPTAPLAKALKERYKNWQEAAAQGHIAQDVFQKMDSAYRNIADMPGAINFNTKFALQK